MKTAITVVTFGVLGVWGLREWRTAHIPAAAAAAPRAAGVFPADNRPPDLFTAHGEMRSRCRVRISAVVSLPIVDLPVREGDRVAKGAVLARLDDSDLQAALRAAEARLAVAKSEINVADVRLVAHEAQVTASRVNSEEAQRDWEHIEHISTASTSWMEKDAARSKRDRLGAEHQAAVREHEASRACLATLQEKLKAAEADVDRARIAVSTATLTSPIDGVVTRVNVAVGEVVTGTINNPGTILMEVADPNRMIFAARVPERAIGTVREGQKATISLNGYGSEHFAGTVERIALAKREEDAGAGYFDVDIQFETGGRLCPVGLNGDATINGDELEGAAGQPQATAFTSAGRDSRQTSSFSNQTLPAP